MPACSGANAMGRSLEKTCAEIQRSTWSFCARGHHKMLWWTGPPVPKRAQDVPNDVREITALWFHPCQRRGQREGAGQRLFAKVCRPPTFTAPPRSRPPTMRRRRPSTIRASRAAAVLPRFLRSAPYEAWAVDRKRNNGVNYRCLSCGLLAGNRHRNSVLRQQLTPLRVARS